jgi:hypothetical protein
VHVILHFVDRAEQALEHDVDLERVAEMPVLRRLQRASEEIPEEKIAQFRLLMARLDEEFDQLEKRQAHAR